MNFRTTLNLCCRAVVDVGVRVGAGAGTGHQQGGRVLVGGTSKHVP